MTILLVDDESLVLRAVSMMLKGIGHRPLSACSGREALEICVRRGAKIDLLLTDIEMPDMSGVALAHCLAKIHATIAVLFMSGHQRETPQMRLLLREGNFRINEILWKPFSVKTLSKALKEVQQKRRKQLATYGAIKSSCEA